MLGVALDWLLPAYLLTVLLTLSERIVIAVILFAAGAGLAIPAMRGFRSAGTHVEPWKPSLTLVTDGIFGWLRNPMYVGPLSSSMLRRASHNRVVNVSATNVL